jgi:hypothetical protein
LPELAVVDLSTDCSGAQVVDVECYEAMGVSDVNDILVILLSNTKFGVNYYGSGIFD